MASLRGYLQDHPRLLVWAWKMTERVLMWMAPLFEKVGWERASRWMHPAESWLKRPLFDCQSCGQCVLHYTGMTCAMMCPKQLRNGPCGGVRPDGHCEVHANRPCVWVQALERVERTPYAGERCRLNPPVDWQLQGEASWVTHAVGRDVVATGGEETIRYAEVPYDAA